MQLNWQSACMKPGVQAPKLYKLGVVEHSCNPSILEIDTGILEVQVHPQPQREFEADLGNRRPLPKDKTSKQTNDQGTLYV